MLIMKIKINKSINPWFLCLKASSGWLAAFLKRHNIVFGTMSGERGDVNKDVVSSWKGKLPTVCEGYDPKDVFNMDETGLFYRDTSRKSYHMKSK